MDKKSIVRNKKGFTLIEIIAVLVILGVLAAVAVPKYIDMADQAKVKAAQVQITEMKSSLNLAYYKYILVNKKLPISAGDLFQILGRHAGEQFYLGVPPDIWKVQFNKTSKKEQLILTIELYGTGSYAVKRKYYTSSMWNLPK